MLRLKRCQGGLFNQRPIGPGRRSRGRPLGEFDETPQREPVDSGDQTEPKPGR